MRSQNGSGRIENVILRKRLKRRTKSLEKQNKRIKRRENENRRLKKRLLRTGSELNDVASRLATSYCPYCEEYNMFCWEPEWGLTSYCPKCGARIMLCEKCSKNGGNCDYDLKTDLCSEM